MLLTAGTGWRGLCRWCLETGRGCRDLFGSASVDDCCWYYWKVPSQRGYLQSVAATWISTRTSTWSAPSSSTPRPQLLGCRSASSVTLYLTLLFHVAVRMLIFQHHKRSGAFLETHEQAAKTGAYIGRRVQGKSWKPTRRKSVDGNAKLYGAF